MTVSRGNYNIFVQLTPVRVVATSNVTGTYNNGPSNNGVNATFTVSSLSFDSVTIVEGDSVLLMDQTAGNQNGIYFLADEDAMILQRRNDFQCAEQIQPGAFVSVAAGTLNAGSMFMVVEPLPAQFGVDDLVFTASPLNSGLGTAAEKAASDDTKATVASVGSAVVSGQIAKFVDTSGTIDDTAGTAANAGNLQAGSSGVAGTLISYPATGSKGSLIIAGVANTGDTTTTISNAAMGQASVVSIPDPGASTANFLISASAGTQTIGTGNVALTAGYVLRSAANALTAHVGGGQGSALQLAKEINRVTTVASAGDSVKLPVSVAGMAITVINAAAANAMDVFGQTGDVINALSANTALSVAANKTVTFYCAVAGTWNTVLTA